MGLLVSGAIGLVLGIIIGGLAIQAKQSDTLVDWFKNHLKDMKREMSENEFVSYTFSIAKEKNNNDDDDGDFFPKNPSFEDSYRNN